MEHEGFMLKIGNLSIE